MSKVSIIIPLYNGEKFIERTIKSCINQSHKDIEIIIIDDCSTDDGLAKVEKFAKNNPKIILHENESNQGIIKNVNSGIKLSKGEYILALGHDDMIPKDHIALMLKGFTDSTSLVFCSSDWIDINDNTILGHKKRDDKIVGLFELSTGNKINSCGLIMNKKLLEKVGYFTESNMFRNYGEWDLWIKLANVGDIAYSSSTISYYRRHDTNITNTFNEIETSKKLHLYWKYCRKTAYKLGDFTLRQKAIFWIKFFKYQIYHRIRIYRMFLNGKKGVS